MLIRRSEGKTLETRRFIRMALAIGAILLVAFGVAHPPAPEVWGVSELGVMLLAIFGAATEIGSRNLLARAGTPVVDFGDHKFLYWRNKNMPPEEIAYTEITAYYPTLLETANGGAEAFVSIEFHKRGQIRLHSSYLDIPPRHLLALIEQKLDTARPEQNT